MAWEETEEKKNPASVLKSSFKKHKEKGGCKIKTPLLIPNSNSVSTQVPPAQWAMDAKKDYAEKTKANISTIAVI